MEVMQVRRGQVRQVLTPSAMGRHVECRVVEALPNAAWHIETAEGEHFVAQQVPLLIITGHYAAAELPEGRKGVVVDKVA